MLQIESKCLTNLSPFGLLKALLKLHFEENMCSLVNLYIKSDIRQFMVGEFRKHELVAPKIGCFKVVILTCFREQGLFEMLLFPSKSQIERQSSQTYNVFIVKAQKKYVCMVSLKQLYRLEEMFLKIRVVIKLCIYFSS